MLTAKRKTALLMTAATGLLVAAGQTIFEGALVATEDGFATKGRTATGLTGFGVAYETKDNSDGGDGDLTVQVRKGTYKFDNDGADPVTTAQIGADCFIHDDHTVSKTDGGGTKSVAGKVFNVEASGVWVTFA